MSDKYSFENKKILVLTSSYPFHSEDYHALFVHEMNQALLQMKASHITVLTPLVPDAKRHEYIDNIEIKRFSYLGFDEKTSNPTGSDGIVENIKAKPYLMMLLPSLFLAFLHHAHKESLRHDLIISHWLLPSGLIGSFFRLPHLALAHGSEVQLLTKLPLKRQILIQILKHSQIHSTSAFLDKKLKKILNDSHYSEQLELTRLGIWSDQKIAQDRLQYRKEETFQLLFMGRILRSKGIERLLKLLPLLRNCSLTFVGDGRDLSWLRQEIAKQQLPARAIGSLRGQEKAQILAQSHLFLFLPEESHHENLPISLLESLAYGLPPLSLDKGGITEILTHHYNSIIIKNNDLQDIAQKITVLQNDPSFWSQLSQNAFLSVQSFQWTKQIERFQGK